MVTPQELKMVSGESNEINGEKIYLFVTAEKKLLLLKRSEKDCMFKLGVKKQV